MLTRLDYIYMTALFFPFWLFSDWETPMPLKPAT